MEETSNSIMIVDKENIIQKLTKIFWIFLIKTNKNILDIFNW